METVTIQHPSRPLIVALALSLAVHLLLGYGLGVRWYESRVAAAAVPPPPEQIRFELVETPESAAVEEARDSRFLSNRNTRSQDRTRPDDPRPIDRRPRLAGEGESHDLRPPGTAPRIAPPAPPAAASPPPSPPIPRAAPTSREAASEAAATSPEEAFVRVERRPSPEPAPPATEERAERQARPRTPRPATPQPPAPQPQREAQAPTAFLPGEVARPGRPSLTEAEAEELARAEAAGEFSFEATRHFFADYFFRLKEKVERIWILMLMVEFRNLDPSKAVIDFKVYPDGSIGEVRIGPGEGDTQFPLVCSLAVKKAAPFGPVPYDALPQLPPGVRDLPLRVRVNFNYQ